MVREPASKSGSVFRSRSPPASTRRRRRAAGETRCSTIYSRTPSSSRPRAARSRSRRAASTANARIGDGHGNRHRAEDQKRIFEEFQQIDVGVSSAKAPGSASHSRSAWSSCTAAGSGSRASLGTAAVSSSRCQSRTQAEWARTVVLSPSNQVLTPQNGPASDHVTIVTRSGHGERSPSDQDANTDPGTRAARYRGHGGTRS